MKIFKLFFRQIAYIVSRVELRAYFRSRAFGYPKKMAKLFIACTLKTFGDI